MGHTGTGLLLATYNGEEYLSTQLDSLLSQTYSDFTIYISDDCSKDSTQNIIDEYVTKYPEKIIDAYNSVENKNQPILVHSDLIVVDGDLREINPSFFDMFS